MSLSSVRNTDSLVQETPGVLESAEERLLALIRRGAEESVDLEDIVTGIDALAAEMQPHFRRLDEALARRDLPFEIVDRLQALRRHWLWLYRKIRLERVFFTKLKLERALRDMLYRQVIETTHQLSSLDEQERILQTMDEEELAKELLAGAQGSDGESVQSPWVP